MRLEDFGFKSLGTLANRKSTEITSSCLGVGLETLDRDMWDVNQACLDHDFADHIDIIPYHGYK